MSVRRVLAMVLPAILATSSPDLHAQSSFTLSGYYKNFTIASALPDYQKLINNSAADLVGQVTNRLLINAGWRANDHVRADVSYNILPRIQDRIFFIEDLIFVNTGALVYRVADLDLRLYPKEGEPASSFAVFQNLDRLFVTLSASKFDLYVGRQAIAWGAARVINPLDVIAPFLYTELDVEDRIGVDAVRLRAPLGQLNELDIGYIAGEDFDVAQSAFFLRSHLYLAPQDITLLALAFRQHALLGFDLARGIGGAGFWLEAAYAWMEAFNSDVIGTGPDYLRLSTGIDYSFPGNVYGYVEYHFNGAGSNDASDYVDLLFTSPYTEASVYLLGKHYLSPGVIWAVSPLWNLGLNLLANLGDPSLLISPVVEYNIAENIYLEGGAFIGLGPAADLQFVPGIPPDVDLTFNSEFGAAADFVYFSFRVYY